VATIFSETQSSVKAAVGLIIPGAGRYSDNRYSDISKWVMQWVRVSVRVRVTVSLSVSVRVMVRVRVWVRVRVRVRVRDRVSVSSAFSEAFCRNSGCRKNGLYPMIPGVGGAVHLTETSSLCEQS